MSMDSNGRWIAHQVESAILNAVARISKPKRARKPRATKVVSAKAVPPAYAVVAARTIKPEWAGDWAGGQFDHDDHLAREAARCGLILMGKKQ